jgi:hypothetical protein
MLNLGETAVTLLSPEKHLLDLAVEVFDALLRQRKVTVATPVPGDSLPTEEQEILQHASVNACIILRPNNFDPPVIQTPYSKNHLAPSGLERQHWCANQV